MCPFKSFSLNRHRLMRILRLLVHIRMPGKQPLL